MITEITNIKGGGMWRDNIEKIFIDIMVTKVNKDNMDNGTISTHTWKKMLLELNS